MYATVIVIDDDRLTSTERLVWYTLCTFARWKFQGKQPTLADNVFPSQETIAQRAGLSRMAVSKAVKKLQELGYIEVISGGNDGRSNKYILKGVNKSDRGVNQNYRGVNDVYTNNNTINKKINNGINPKEKRRKELEQERAEDPEAWERFMADIKERVSKHGTDIN